MPASDKFVPFAGQLRDWAASRKSWCVSFGMTCCRIGAHSVAHKRAMEIMAIEALEPQPLTYDEAVALKDAMMAQPRFRALRDTWNSERYQK